METTKLQRKNTPTDSRPTCLLIVLSDSRFSVHYNSCDTWRSLRRFQSLVVASVPFNFTNTQRPRGTCHSAIPFCPPSNSLPLYTHSIQLIASQGLPISTSSSSLVGYLQCNTTQVRHILVSSLHFNFKIVKQFYK